MIYEELSNTITNYSAGRNTYLKSIEFIQVCSEDYIFDYGDINYGLSSL